MAISLSIIFIDKKYNISNKLSKKYDSLLFVRIFELIIGIFLIYLISSSTDIDGLFVSGMASGIGVAAVRKV